MWPLGNTLKEPALIHRYCRAAGREDPAADPLAYGVATCVPACGGARIGSAANPEDYPQGSARCFPVPSPMIRCFALCKPRSVGDGRPSTPTSISDRWRRHFRQRNGRPRQVCRQPCSLRHQPQLRRCADRADRDQRELIKGLGEVWLSQPPRSITIVLAEAVIESPQNEQTELLLQSNNCRSWHLTDVAEGSFDVRF
jgi:hypothetical protein